MDEVVRYTWGQYRVWAATSRALKARITRWSLLVLALTVAGTGLGTMGPFLPVPPRVGATLPWIAAVALGMAAYFTSQLLGDSARESWVKTRAMAEALKSECYLYVTRTPPFDHDDAADVLAGRTEALLRSAPSILAVSISENERSKGFPNAAWTVDDYVAQRVREQIDGFYRGAITRHRHAVRVGQVIAIAFGIVAVILSASTGSRAPGSASWMGALLGAVTTAAAAIAAWFQSGNHLQNALSYQTVVAKLELLLAQRHAPGREAKLVADAESIFQAEHAAWLMQWQTQAPTDKPLPKSGP
jgi:SMODS and SLOG-associating 2TM effector domain 1/Protein of unknown function (DUF4231)